MKIKQVKELDDGVSGITIEGKIIKTPKPPNSGEYGWSQMIILKDDTGEIGSWIKIASAEDAYKVGQYIKVQGKVSRYMKGDKPGISLNNGQVMEEIVRDEIVQAPAQSSTESSTESTKESSTQPNTQPISRDDYWAKKFEWDKLVHFSIIRQCSIKAVTELAKIPPSKTFLIKVHTEKDFFVFADKIQDYIRKKITSEDIIKEFGGEIIGTSEDGIPEVETKKERTKKAEEIVGETRFKPASTKQKNVIFGYKDKEGFHKGIIDSRYIETEEIKKIGDPKKMSVEQASEWIEFWWGEQGNPEDIGARKQREIENPRDKNGKPVNALVKGDKTSLVKEVLIDEVNALRREHRLNDDEKFEKETGSNPKIEELSEAELTRLKGILKRYIPF